MPWRKNRSQPPHGPAGIPLSPVVRANDPIDLNHSGASIASDPKGTTRRAGVVALFAIAVAALLAFCNHYANRLSGATDAPLTWDSAEFLRQAIEMKRSIEARGIFGFADGWVHSSAVQAPLVPMLSALAMLLFGESRAVAESVIPLFTFIFLYSIVRAVERLFIYCKRPPGVAPFAIAAFSLTFPGNLELSKLYLYEFPLAAMSALFFSTLLSTNFFTDTKRSIFAGVVAGLVGVTRAGGPALLVGPALVYFMIAICRRPFGTVARNSLAALAAAIAVALTWYGPNLVSLYNYIHSVTYGDRAALYTTTGSSLSVRNSVILLQWSIVDGPGFPAFAAGAIAWLILFASRHRGPLLACAAGLGSAWLIDFIIICFATQQNGGILMLAAMPLLAALILLPVFSIASKAMRTLLFCLIAAFGLHHVVDLTFRFSTDPGVNSGYGPFRDNFPLWNHRNCFLSITRGTGYDPAWRDRLRECADTLERLTSERTGRRTPLIFLLADHPLFHCNGVALAGAQRGYKWQVQSLDWMPAEQAQMQHLNICQRMFLGDFLIMPEGPQANLNSYQGFLNVVIPALLSGGSAPFRDTGLTIPYHDASKLRFYARRPDLDWKVAEPPSAVPIATFESAPGSREKVDVLSATVEAVGGLLWGSVVLQFPRESTSTPEFAIWVTDMGGAKIGEIGIPADQRDRIAPRPKDASVAELRILLSGGIPPRLPLRGFRAGLVVSGSPGGKRWTPTGGNTDTAGASQGPTLMIHTPPK